MFKFCPACASPKITFEDGKLFRCPACGFVYYHNIAAATACIISVPSDSKPADGSGERIMFLVRGKEPGKGKLDLPGGFVDTGEGALEGLHRELNEEIGWTPPVPPGASMSDVYRFFGSFANVYPYREISYNTCDLYFSICAPGLNEKDLVLEKAEISGICFLKPEVINFDDIAFDSTRRAVKAYLANHGFVKS